MNYLSVESLAKGFGERQLFQELSFGIQKGEKTALVARNGSGKTTLMKILTGKESADTGRFSFRKDIRIGFLDQDPQFKEGHNVLDAVLDSPNPLIQLVKKYEACLQNPEAHEQMQEVLLEMDNQKAWDFENKIKMILTRLRVDMLDRPVALLSGGQKKRVALAKVLIDEPDFFLLDEPTNHLDLDMIEWLEEFLIKPSMSLLMVTHDRYFLERVCNQILEIDEGQIFRYVGNYSEFLQKKEERETLAVKEVEKARNLMRKELDWIRRQPKARGTKAKYRIDAFQELKKTAQQSTSKKELQMEMEMNRLGKKIVELEKVSKAYGDNKILDQFSYIFKRKERVGIVGANGAGKSTFLKILTGELEPDQGEVIVGDTIVFGHYRQDGIQLDEDKRVIEVVQDIAEYIQMGKGNRISAAQLLERFLFSPKRQYSYVSTLSGGERRRLYLLTILARNPNFLILDEPTNDLDILTLNVLEDFLVEFGGCLIIVSHDRYFLDKLVDHLLILEGQALIRDFNGGYSEYRATRELEEENKRKSVAQKPKAKTEKTSQTPSEKKKLSFKEKREYESLEADIEKLESQKEALEALLNSGSLEHEALQKKASELGEIMKELDEKTDRWLYLSEFI